MPVADLGTLQGGGDGEADGEASIFDAGSFAASVTPSDGVREFGEQAAADVSYQAAHPMRQGMRRSMLVCLAVGAALVGSGAVVLLRGLFVDDDGGGGSGGGGGSSGPAPLACDSGHSVRGQCVPVGVSPLHFYVQMPDEEYTWSVTQTLGPGAPGGVAGVTIYALNVTSQRWLTDRASDKSVWWCAPAAPLCHPPLLLRFLALVRLGRLRRNSERALPAQAPAVGGGADDARRLRQDPPRLALAHGRFQPRRHFPQRQHWR